MFFATFKKFFNRKKVTIKEEKSLYKYNHLIEEIINDIFENYNIISINNCMIKSTFLPINFIFKYVHLMKSSWMATPIFHLFCGHPKFNIDICNILLHNSHIDIDCTDDDKESILFSSENLNYCKYFIGELGCNPFLKNINNQYFFEQYYNSPYIDSQLFYNAFVSVFNNINLSKQ